MARGSGVAMSCGIGHRRGSNLALLWLWCRAAATTPIRPLTWEPPHASRAALEKAKKRKERLVHFVTKLNTSIMTSKFNLYSTVFLGLKTL